MVEGKVWPCLYFLNWHAINELMTFPKFLAKSCYWNSFLLNFQDNLLLFKFFYHYINNGVFIHLKWVITACVQWTKGEGGGKSNWRNDDESSGARFRWKRMTSFPVKEFRTRIFLRDGHHSFVCRNKEKRFSNHTADQCCHCFPCTMLPGLSRANWSPGGEEATVLSC